MQRYRRKERDKIKLGKSYLIGAISFNLIAQGIAIYIAFSVITYYGALNLIGATWLFPFVIAVLLLIFSYFYFFGGLNHLRKAIKEISNKLLIFYGVFSYLLFTPLFLTGLLNAIECTQNNCKWSFSGLNMILISLSVLLFTSGLVSLFHEIGKMKGSSLEIYLNVKTEEKSVEPISKKLYKVRIETSGGDLEEKIYVCGNCGEKNRFKTIDEETGLLQCINCGSENYLAQ
jgi:DNA-directed RNA polymerase subunit RPC12/RpoP